MKRHHPNSFAITPLASVALRRGPSHRAELRSQLLFGEIVEITELRGNDWCRVRCPEDGLEAYALKEQLLPITGKERQAWEANFAFALDLFQPIHGPNSFFPISPGARLPKFDGLRFRLNQKLYTYSGQAVNPEELLPSAELLASMGQKFLNAPFLWGGRTPFGIDSPGLIQLIYRLVGIQLPRFAEQQVAYGSTVDFAELARAGDLAFFENRSGRIAYTGLLLPNQRILYVAEKVRIDQLDHFGIFNVETKTYTHRLRIIKRLLPQTESQNGYYLEQIGSQQQQLDLF